MKAFDYAIATDVAGARAALDEGYQIKAGGIDLLDLLKSRLPEQEKYVSIHRIGGLGGIREEGSVIVIGALATLRDISESAMLQKRFPGLVDSVASAATPQVRVKATAAGNIMQRPRCWYFRSPDHPCLKKGGSTCFAVEGENRYHAIMGGGPCHIVHPSNLAIPLVAADAIIMAVNPDGDETQYEAADFFELPRRNMYGETALDEDELITEIRLPRTPEKSAFVDFKEKKSFDWPLASCVAAYQDGAWRVVLGHVAPIPWRSEAAEEVLGSTADVSEDLAARAADAAVAEAEPMSDNAWRIRLARAAVRRALLKACGKAVV